MRIVSTSGSARQAMACVGGLFGHPGGELVERADLLRGEGRPG
ncbi:hypothetical protein [Streptomyces sp. ALI-76-A]|nr:hypothetical protein [Streptomyces sp. ALI-76-A]MDL5206006.1 hypothetical protein [Streptomyces sp. ALI-76-A]